MQLGIAGTAIGVSKLVASGFFEQLPAEDILEIMATLCMVYVGLAGIGFATRRRPKRPLLLLRLGTALVIGLIGLVAVEGTLVRAARGSGDAHDRRARARRARGASPVSHRADPREPRLMGPL